MRDLPRRCMWVNDIEYPSCKSERPNNYSLSIPQLYPEEVNILYKAYDSRSPILILCSRTSPFFPKNITLSNKTCEYCWMEYWFIDKRRVSNMSSSMLDCSWKLGGLCKRRQIRYTFPLRSDQVDISSILGSWRRISALRTLAKLLSVVDTTKRLAAFHRVPCPTHKYGYRTRWDV